MRSGVVPPRVRMWTLLALLGVSISVTLAVLFHGESGPTSVRRTSANTRTSNEPPHLEGQGRQQSRLDPQPPVPGGRWVRVVVEVVDRHGKELSGGQLSAARVDGAELPPIHAVSSGAPYVLRLPAEGPASWGVSYVDQAAGYLSGPRGLNKLTILGQDEPAERLLRIIAFETGSVFVEVVDESGSPVAGVPCRTSPVSAWKSEPHLTDQLGQTRVPGVVGFVHVRAGPEGKPGAASQQLTVQPGEVEKVRLVLPRDVPIKEVPVYVESGQNQRLAGQRVRVTVLSKAVGVAEGPAVVDGDPLMLPIDPEGPITAIIKDSGLGPVVLQWQGLGDAGSQAELRIVIGVRHRVRLRLLGQGGVALPSLNIGYRKLGSGEPAKEASTGLIEFRPAGNTSARTGLLTTDDSGEVLTPALRAGVYEVSTDRYQRTWDQQFHVPGDASIQELRVDEVGVLSGRIEGPLALAGQRVVIQARPWADFHEKRSEVVLAMPGEFWTTSVRSDGSWAMSIQLPPGSDLGCAATLPYTWTPFEMRRTLDLARVELGTRDVILRSNVPGTWAVARLALRQGKTSALIGHAELRLVGQEDRSGLLVPLVWGQRTTAGPLAPGAYAVYFHEEVDLGPRTLGGPAASGGVRAISHLILVAGEHDYDIEIPE